ncbi:uncharacterized protein LOC117319402, partial [Pecten maximus]|uniref:uncharacterized protein LOC117319402 n=1 Tax=Pecten maximus TaxID=6579 RepID=UPI001458A936
FYQSGEETFTIHSEWRRRAQQEKTTFKWKQTRRWISAYHVITSTSGNNINLESKDIEALCLNEAVLVISQWLWNDLMALEDDEETTKGFMHAAFRQFVLWLHHRLWAGVPLIHLDHTC